MAGNYMMGDTVYISGVLRVTKVNDLNHVFKVCKPLVCNKVRELEFLKRFHTNS